MNPEEEAKLCHLMANCMHMLDFARATTISYWLLHALELDGDVVEVGCYNGDTAKLMAAIMAKTQGKRLFLYDSFEGLPERSSHDIARADFVKGHLKTSAEAVRKNFVRDNLPVPMISQGWVEKMDEKWFPEKIVLAHLDLDFYAGTKRAIKLVWPRIVDGGYLIGDDFGWTGLPGVKKAFEEMFPKVEIKRQRGRGQLSHQVVLQKSKTLFN